MNLLDLILIFSLGLSKMISFSFDIYYLFFCN